MGKRAVEDPWLVRVDCRGHEPLLAAMMARQLPKITGHPVEVAVEQLKLGDVVWEVAALSYVVERKSMTTADFEASFAFGRGRGGSQLRRMLAAAPGRCLLIVEGEWVRGSDGLLYTPSGLPIGSMSWAQFDGLLWRIRMSGVIVYLSSEMKETVWAIGKAMKMSHNPSSWLTP